MKMNNGETANGGENKLISFRPLANEPLASVFWELVQQLGVNGSTLARRAVIEGLEIAAEKILKEKAEEASRIKQTVKRGISLTTAPLCGWGAEWTSPVLSPVV